MVAEYLLERSTFKTDTDLKSITSRVESYDSAADQTRYIEENIVTTTDGQIVIQFPFKINYAVDQRNKQIDIQIEDNALIIDAQ